MLLRRKKKSSNSNEMDVIKLINKCIKEDISLSIENDELIIEANEGVITEDILADIRSGKQEIISFLKCKKGPLSFAQ